MLIICLVGVSGTGKSTVATCLEQRINNAVNNPKTLIPGLTNMASVIKSYTTRERRNEKDDDHTYVTEDMWKYVYEYERHNIVAFTKYGHHYYWVMKQQFTKQLVSIFVVDPKGVYDLKEANVPQSIFTTLVTLPEHEIRTRLMDEYIKKHSVVEAHKMVVERMDRNKADYANFKADLVIENENSFDTAKLILKDAISYYPMRSFASVNEIGILRWALQ